MRKKQAFEDDGRVIADMNVDGMPWHSGHSKKKNNPTKALESLTLTKGERRAIIGALVSIVMKLALIFVGGFFIVFLIFYLMWR